VRDVSDLSVAAVRRLISEATGRRLADLVAAYSDDVRPGVRDAVATASRRMEAERAEQRRLSALYRMEAALRRSGESLVAGIDEVGRGAIAGPLTVAACVLPPKPAVLGLDDSKRLRPVQRERIALQVKEVAVAYSVVHVPAAVVDSHGLTSALHHAMRRSIESLGVEVARVIIDGHPIGLFPNESAVVGGDRKVAAVAAASVLAKVERDKLMCALADTYPQYGFEIHKGYGTASHVATLEALGPCPEHRRSFAPGGGTGRLF